jgi:porin
MRVKYNLQPDLYTQVGVYEYNPENLDRGKGFNLSTDGSLGPDFPGCIHIHQLAYINQVASYI